MLVQLQMSTWPAEHILLLSRCLEKEASTFKSWNIIKKPSALNWLTGAESKSKLCSEEVAWTTLLIEDMEDEHGVGMGVLQLQDFCN